MVFKNSIKLFFANFSTMWKMLLYYIICLCVIFCLALPVIDPITQAVNASGVLEEIKSVLTQFNISANIFTLFEQVYLIFILIFNVITDIFATNAFAVIYILFLLFWLLPFLLDLAEIPTCEMIYGYMSSCTKYGFTSTFIKRMGTSAVVGVMKTTVKAIMNVLFLVGAFYIIKIIEFGGIIYYAVPFIFVAYFSIVMSIEEMLFGGWVPSIVCLNCKTFEGFKKGLETTFKYMVRNFSTYTMLVLACILVNYFFGTIAFAVLLPMSALLIKIASVVMFFTGQGMRYYVDLDTIITPQKFEESDNFKKVIDIL